MKNNIQTRREFIHLLGKATFYGMGAAYISALFTGCKTFPDSIAQAGVASGLITSSQAESLKKVGNAVIKSAQDFTPEQEYYIGRTMAAVILDKYKPYSNKRANQYVNTLGQTLAQFSDRPETFGGYHFMIQDSDEINALAAPGGFIFVTRGMLRCCQHEDALASVLAHEIGHVEHSHGLAAIKKARYSSAGMTLLAEGAKTFGSAEVAQLTATFEDCITDISKTLINNGYSRGFERQADESAVTILKRVGYNPNGLVDMLNIMKTHLKPGGLDFAKTHPSPQSRIADIQKLIGSYTKVQSPKSRTSRFRRAMAKV